MKLFRRCAFASGKDTYWRSKDDVVMGRCYVFLQVEGKQTGKHSEKERSPPLLIKPYPLDLDPNRVPKCD